MLLQAVLSSKAQKVYIALAVDEHGNYEIVKESILKAYQLVPEEYRQKFWNYQKD